MAFLVYLPCEPLLPYVKQLALSESDVGATYRVLPDTSVVLGFQYKGALAFVEAGAETSLAAFGVTGLLDRYRLFRNTPGVGSVLVYFREGMARAFFRAPLHELFGASIGLDHFLPAGELERIGERLSQAQTELERLRCIETVLLAHLRPQPEDLLVQGALALIDQYKGTLPIAQLAEKLHTSASPLEKRFRAAVGSSPKQFSQVVRFQHLLRQGYAKGGAEAAYEAGYYDQAHLIHSFRRHTGVTPEQYFRADASEE